MSSLHARRPPKLQQGDLRRKNKQRSNNNDSTAIKVGGGRLRRPPNALAGGDTLSPRNNRSSGGGRLFKMILCIAALFVLLYLRGGLKWHKNTNQNSSGISSSSGLRASNNSKNVESISTNIVETKPG